MKTISEEEALNFHEEGHLIYSTPKDSIPNLDCGTHATPSDMKKDILEERQETHGDFTWVAETSQELKEYFRNKADWYNLTNVQREALDNIAQKTARIFAGNPNFADHWVDIQGYAKLAEKEIRKGENQDGPTSPK
jgi:hypothetical protein